MAKRNVGAEIVAGLNEFRDKPEKLKRYEFEPADVKGIRLKFGMTQQQFADFLMISVRTLQKWEQGERDPDGASHTLTETIMAGNTPWAKSVPRRAATGVVVGIISPDW